MQVQSGTHTVITTVNTTTITIDPAITIHYGRTIPIIARRAEPPPTYFFRKVTIFTCFHLIIQQSIFFTAFLPRYFCQR